MPNQITWTDLQSQLASFSKRLNLALNELAIKDSCLDLKIDHACIRLKNNLDVDKLKTELCGVGEIISATKVNGREIIIFELGTSITINDWQTSGIELPYPKLNHNYQDGWEHVEFVLSNIENTTSAVREAFFSKFPNLDQSQLVEKYQYSEDEPHAKGDKLPNPTIGLKVGNIGIKFHATSIQEVVGFRAVK